MNKCSQINTQIDKYINIGSFRLQDNEDVVVDMMDREFKHTKGILDTHEKINDGYKEIDSFSYQAEKLIKKRIFPTYQTYCEIFTPNYHKDMIYNQLDFMPSSWKSEKNAFTANRKATVEDYVKFVKQYAHPTIKQKLRTPVDLYIDPKYIEKSTYVSGKSGSGKTELLKNLIMTNINRRDSSLIIIDIAGDYTLQIAQILPEKERDRLIFIDLFAGDEQGVMPSINPFEISDTTDETLIEYTTQNIVNTLKAIIGAEFTLVMQSLLAPMINTLLRIEGSSFYDLYKFCDDDLNKELVEFGIANGDEMTAHYLKFDFYKADNRTKKALKIRLQMLLNYKKFAQFLTGKSTFNLQEAMELNQIIIFRFNRVKLQEVMSPIGRFIISFVQTYAMLRENQEESQRETTYLYIDEFQQFVSPEIDLILSESRKYKLYLILAHQFSQQLENPRIKESILANTQIKITGLNAYTHNKAMSNQFGVKVEDLEKLEKVGEFYFRKNNDKAFKFTASDKYVDIWITPQKQEEWEKLLQIQLNTYYKRVEEKESLFVEVPIINTTEQQSVKNHYSKDTTDKILTDVLINSSEEDELLDF